MTVPTMDPDNVLAKLTRRVTDLERFLTEFRAASGTLSNATISKGGVIVQEGGGIAVRDGGDITVEGGGDVLVNDGGDVLINDGGNVITHDTVTGSRMLLGRGNVAMWDNFDDNPTGYGRIYTDPGSGKNYLRFFPPYSAGSGSENSVTVRGRAPGQLGAVWIYTDGTTFIESQKKSWVKGVGGVVLDGPQLELYGLPAVGSPDYSLGYDLSGGDWSVCLITSAAKYKQDITPAAIDPDAVLAIEPVTFRSKTSVEKDPDAKTEFGVIADQLDELGLGDLLVTYRDGEPDAVKYDRVCLALLPVVKRQAEQVADMQDQIDALTRRLDALEGVTH